MIKWHHRQNTNDLGIIDQVYTNNVCHLPEDMFGMLFVDIGAHIGAASVLAATRGAKVVAYEPEVSNYQILLQNIEENNFKITW